MILVVETIDPGVMQWLVGRHPLRYAPELARDAGALRQALETVQALISPASVAIDSELLEGAPQLRAVGRVSSGIESIDADACMRAGVEVVRCDEATAAAEAEFVIGALLQLLRRVPVVSAEGMLVGRELGGSTVGLIGMPPTAEHLSDLLRVFGARVVGYDPAMHANQSRWPLWGVSALGLRELFETCDAVCVMLGWFSRYRGLLGERYLPHCRPNQVLVSLSPSGVFDEAALAEALGSGRMAAAWFDGMDPRWLAPGRPLATIDSLQVTPGVAATTRESRKRSAWEVAQRIDELLANSAAMTFVD